MEAKFTSQDVAEAMTLSNRFTEANKTFKGASHAINDCFYVGTFWVNDEQKTVLKNAMAILDELASNTDYHSAMKYFDKERAKQSTSNE